MLQKEELCSHVDFFGTPEKENIDPNNPNQIRRQIVYEEIMLDIANDNYLSNEKFSTIQSGRADAEADLNDSSRAFNCIP